MVAEGDSIVSLEINCDKAHINDRLGCPKRKNEVNEVNNNYYSDNICGNHVKVALCGNSEDYGKTGVMVRRSNAIQYR